IWADATYTYFSTTYQGSSLPSYSGTSGLALSKLILQPAPSVSFSGCSGCADINDLAQFPAHFLYERSRRTYSGNIGTQPSVKFWGKLVRISVNVTKPFTGTGALPFNFAGQFGCVVFSSSNVWSLWNPTVDLRTAGERIITPGSVTGTG